MAIHAPFFWQVSNIALGGPSPDSGFRPHAAHACGALIDGAGLSPERFDQIRYSVVTGPES